MRQGHVDFNPLIDFFTVALGQLQKNLRDPAQDIIERKRLDLPVRPTKPVGNAPAEELVS